MTRRAMAVTAATLTAPLVALAGLAAIGVSGGGGQAEMGTLAGAQGLRGTTVAATSPAPQPSASAPPVRAPKGREKDLATTSSGGHHFRSTKPPSEPRSAPHTRAPTHKTPPTTVPKTPPKRVNLTPPPTSTDPSEPGAPTTSGGSDGPGGSGSGTGSSGGSSTGSGGPDDPSGQTGGTSGQTGGD
jgi:hypothetical protein